MTLPSDKQVGGDHYKGMVIQLSEFIHKNDIGWMEGNAIKYIVRHSRKHGADDIDKAIHYLEMLKEWKYSGESPPPREEVPHPADKMWVNPSAEEVSEYLQNLNTNWDKTGL